MSSVTTHVLDTARGRPAEGIAVVLEQFQGGLSWVELGRGVTNAEGRITTLLSSGAAVAPGNYRLSFATSVYFAAFGLGCFFPEVQVVFRIEEPAGHYHVPLLLSPFGYTTYRGS